jgi:hypothetical protein
LPYDFFGLAEARFWLGLFAFFPVGLCGLGASAAPAVGQIRAAAPPLVRYKYRPMTDEPAYVRAFKDFARGGLALDDLSKIEAEIYGASDRAAAVVLGSMVESSLGTFLKAKIRKDLKPGQKRRLFDYEGPLGTFSAKIILTYAMELIGPVTHHDLDLIRVIRNEFAHSRRHLNFDATQTANVCKHLKYPDLPGASMQFIALKTAAEELGKNPNLSDSRTRYRLACHTISSRLIKNVSILARVTVKGTEEIPPLP